MNEFSLLLEQLSVEIDFLLMIGDLNLNVKTLIDLIDTFNLRKNVVGPTHRKGHALDLIFTRTDEDLISNPL